MNIDDQVRVFVASTEKEWLPAKVLEFSIREHTSAPVLVASIYTFNREYPLPKETQNRPRTPFSFQRFLVPEFCGYSGKAIYFDADMQLFRDIRGLWNLPFEGADLLTVPSADNGRRGQFSVMLLDCVALRWCVEDIVADLNAGRITYDQLMYEMCLVKRIGYKIPTHWNSLEQYDAGSTSLLHYTDMNTQPWVTTVNPLSHLWVSCLRRAIQSGFITETEVAREIADGHVRPSLLPQIDVGIDNTLDLPAAMRRLDHSFVAPYRRLHSGSARPWTSARTALFALLRRCYYRSPLPRLFG